MSFAIGKNFRLAWVAALMAAAMPASAISAEPVIEEIVVTGEFRPEDIDRVPSSISVVGEHLIEARGAAHLEDIAVVVPNLNLASGASRARYFQIRGIGERGQFAEPLNSSVGLIIDGVDFSGIGTVGTLFDVDQVEVFRGPQGTRYGANALAGLINVATRGPTAVPEARFRVEAGNYDTRAVGAAVAGPLGDRVGYRLAAEQLVSDGFLDNDFLDRDDANERDELTTRAKLRWEASDTTAFDLATGWVNVDNGYDAFSLDNDRTTLSDEPGHDRQKSLYAALKTTIDGADAARLEVNVAGADSDSDYGYDEDWTFVGFHPFGYSSTDRYLRDRRTVTGEARLTSKEGGRLFGGTTDWVVGVYGLTQEEDLTRRYTFLESDFDSEFGIDRAAVFGQLDVALADWTTVTAGLRLERHQSHYRDGEGVQFDPEDDLWGARLGVDRLLDDQTLVYASVARGYKAGGFNTDGTLDADLRDYDPEVLYNYEIGAKGSYFDDRLKTRVSLFYMQREDVQISSSVVRVRDNGSVEFIDYVGNAAEGTNYGLEGEVEWRPVPAVNLFATLGLLESEYENFVNSRGIDLDGREQAHAPGYQFSAGAEYRWRSGAFVRVGVEGRDEFYFSDSENFASDPYELVQASAGMARDGWSVKLWARNLTDEDYPVRGYFFGNDPRLDYAEAGYTQLGAPRRVGVTAEWEL